MAVSRRSFLTRGSVAVAGAAGASVVGLGVTASGAGAEPELDAEEIAASTDPVFIHIVDAAAGEVELLVRDQSIVFTDKSLVARVLRASR